MYALSDLMIRLWRRWQGLIHGINETIGAVLMTFTYLLAVTPVSVLFRLFSPDPTDRGLGDPQAKSYWKPVQTAGDANDIRRVQRQY